MYNHIIEGPTLNVENLLNNIFKYYTFMICFLLHHKKYNILMVYPTFYPTGGYGTNI